MAPIWRKSVDLDKHHRDTNVRLVLGGFLIIAVVGGLALWALYGQTVALLGIAAITAGCGVFLLLWLFLRAIEKWANSQ